MKFELNGAIVEIKVTPVGAKKADPLKSDRLADDISLALLHAANFCSGNGLDVAANHYLNIADAMMNNKI